MFKLKIPILILHMKLLPFRPIRHAGFQLSLPPYPHYLMAPLAFHGDFYRAAQLLSLCLSPLANPLN
jgi:hypothetical protein